MEEKIAQMPYLKNIWQLMGSLNESSDLLGLLESALKQTIDSSKAEAGTFWHVEQVSEQIIPLVALGPNAQSLSRLRLNKGEGIAGWVIDTGESLIVHDVTKDAKWSSRFDIVSGFKTKSIICIPVTIDKSCIGCIQLINKNDGSVFNNEDLSLCQNLATVIGYSLEKNGFSFSEGPSGKVILSVKNVTKTYNTGETMVTALNNVTLEVLEGELLVILGASGSGKSTLLNILGGIDTPTEGEVLSGEKILSKASNKLLTKYRRDDIGFVFQSYNLIPDLTAYENISLAAKLVKNPMSVDEALDAVGLSQRSKHFPHQMSGGEQQRVSIARALVKRPKLLLCDEPTGALDHRTGKIILGILEKISREMGNTVIIVTHNNAMAAVADRVVRMRSGQIVELSKNPSPLSAERIEL